MTTLIRSLGSAKKPHEPVHAKTEEYVRELWFKTEPLVLETCHRIVELQLRTYSCDQGSIKDRAKGSWSWFEIAIFADADATQPRTHEDGEELSYRSHCNILHTDNDPVQDDPKKRLSTHFGNMFDRRDKLLTELQVGNVLGVRVCAGLQGWANYAQEGVIIARVLEDDPPGPSWSLIPGGKVDNTPHLQGENGLFTLVPANKCVVGAKDNKIVSKIWFTSPVLNQEVADNIGEIQLFTTAHNQGRCDDPSQGMWTWFDIMILDSPKATTPKIGEDGRALVWKSHDIHINTPKYRSPEEAGETFNRSHELLRALKVGNVIAIRVCARFQGWTATALDARLVVKISNKFKNLPPAEELYDVDWKAVATMKTKVERAMAAYLKVPETSGEELRSDKDYGAGKPKLRLLSLDGGGVRGISSLYILQAIMQEVADDKNAKPCDYFDMICGTSTGGLIAIMLGRLRMSIPECIDAYDKLSREIFPAPEKAKKNDNILVKTGAFIKEQVSNVVHLGDFVLSGAKYDENILVNAIKAVVEGKTGDADAKMKDAQDGDCKVFVVSVNAKNLNNKPAIRLRTYTRSDLEKTEFDDYTIWRASRATTAAPGYFHRAEDGDYLLVDGGVGFNNPVILLINEAHIHYGWARQIGVLITIGTGMEPNIALPKEASGVLGPVKNVEAGLYGYNEQMADLATSAEGTAILASESIEERDAYYRFNVGIEDPKHPGNWVKPIDLADWNGMKQLVKETETYIGTEVQKKRAKLCAAALPPKHSKSV